MEKIKDYTNIIKHDTSISICFNIDDDTIIKIGEKINQINTLAYMNGYNWQAFFNYYLPKYAPDIFDGMRSDPEADMYVAYYPLTEQNENKAKKLVQIIHSLIENTDELYKIVKEEGNNIEWD